MNNTCDRCHKTHAPMTLLNFSYNGVSVNICFICLKIVLASLYALPVAIRVEHLRRWQAKWQESEARV